jgi:hypothetical protein
MVKSKIGIQVVFNHITEARLTPNQFYLIYCMNQGITAPTLNIHQELRSLIAIGFITEESDKEEAGNIGCGINYKLQPEALSLISKIDSYFGVQVKKSNNALMGQDFEANALKYNEIFPKMKLPSNKPARSPLKEIIVAFREFFKDYDYTWDIIHAATEYYIEEEEKKGFKYTRTSRYFIRKQDSDKSWISDLAGYCELIKNGEDHNEPKFIEKTF